MNHNAMEMLEGFERYAKYLADESRPRLASSRSPKNTYPGASELNQFYGDSYRREIEAFLQYFNIFQDYYDKDDEIHQKIWGNINLFYFRLLGLERQYLLDGPLRGVDTEQGQLHKIDDPDSSTSCASAAPKSGG